MVFSSLIFLFYFFPIFFLVYWLAPKQYRNLWIILASCFFYAWGAPKFIGILLFTSLLDYYWSKLIYAKRDHPKLKKAIVSISIVWNVSLLAYFKYSNFFIGEFNSLLGHFGFTEISWSQVLLPVGISFFVFHKISYIVDIYRGNFKPANNIIDFLVYILLFPQLVAGPIIRYHDIADQISDRKSRLDDAFEGLVRFCIGLAKKVLIADSLAEVANFAFDTNANDLSAAQAWLGIICYALQIYFDFSGYSDMAIGMGRMMGFRFLENFNCPYISQNITEFWKRWHISLSNWMKEYLYIPLGGNRVSISRCYMNLWIVFIFSGLWHGASWNFLIWGVFHGTFLVIDRMFWIKASASLPKVFNIIITFLIILIGWVFFRAETLPEALSFLSRMFSFSGESNVLWINMVSNRSWGVLYIAILFAFIPSLSFIQKLLSSFYQESPSVLFTLIKLSLAICLFILSAAALINSDFHPFIYFRF